MFTLPSIMRGPKWAGCGLLSLALFGIVLLGKVIAIILGAVWILGKEGALCVRKEKRVQRKDEIIARFII